MGYYSGLFYKRRACYRHNVFRRKRKKVKLIRTPTQESSIKE
jgi:hypothetical protein